MIGGQSAMTRRVASARNGAADRVRRSHAQTRVTVRRALAFIGVAALTWAMGDSSWVPLHLFLAGGVVLAISGVSLMLTVTWSAAPAPPDHVVMLQRACVAVGAAGVVLARELELCYANVSLVTDHDVGIAGAGGVTSQTIDRVMDESMERLRTLIAAAIPRIAPQPDDECSTALARARL